MGVKETDGQSKRRGTRPAQPSQSAPDAEEATQVAAFDRSSLDDASDDDDGDDRRPVVVPSALEEDAPTDRGRAVRAGVEARAEVVAPRRPEVRPVSARAIVERAVSLPSPEPVAAPEPPKRTLRLPPVGGSKRSESAAAVPADRPVSPPSQGSGGRASARDGAAPRRAALEALGEPPPEPRAARALPLSKLSPAYAAAERSSAIARWGVAAIAVVALGVAGVFVWGSRRAPISVEAQREEGVAARELLRTRPSLYRSFKDEAQAADPDLVVRSPLPIPLPAGAEVVAEHPPGHVLAGDVPRVRRRGGSRLAFGFREPGADEQLAYGFEVPERPKKREYDTGDAPPPELLSMLLVFSEPAGVAVDVDGTLVGVTPVLRPVAPDKQLVDVRLWGGAYKDQRFTLKKGADGNFQLGVTMELKAVDRSTEAKPRPAGQASAGPVRKEDEEGAPKPTQGGAP